MFFAKLLELSSSAKFFKLDFNSRIFFFSQGNPYMKSKLLVKRVPVEGGGEGQEHTEVSPFIFSVPLCSPWDSKRLKPKGKVTCSKSPSRLMKKPAELCFKCRFLNSRYIVLSTLRFFLYERKYYISRV